MATLMNIGVEERVTFPQGPAAWAVCDLTLTYADSDALAAVLAIIAGIVTPTGPAGMVLGAVLVANAGEIIDRANRGHYGIKVHAESTMVAALPGAHVSYLPIGDEGMITKGSGAEVYLVTGGKRCWITSPDVFNGRGLSWDQLVEIGDSELAEIPIGPDIR